MIELKSKHLWPVIEAFSTPGEQWPDESGESLHTTLPVQTVAAMLDDLRALEAENARLRAILSDADVIGAIRTVCRNLAERDANDEWLPERDAIHVWLQSLESESADDR